MNVIERLLEAGFSRAIVLDAAECGVSDAQSLVLALWYYCPEKHPDTENAWFHPYYPQSQRAYHAAAAVAEQLKEEGVVHRSDVLFKPILQRLPGFTLGRNTISYAPGQGSRFHVQALSLQEGLPADLHLLPERMGVHCQECTRCMEVCPTGAIDREGFHRERCLRNWMLSSKPVPEAIRGKMGNRFVGCDECQRQCPHNPPPEGETQPSMPIREILQDPKAAADALRPVLGVNLAIPNRVLSQACLNAGCSGDASLIPLLEELTEHPSPVVAEHAAWAVRSLKK